MRRALQRESQQSQAKRHKTQRQKTERSIENKSGALQRGEREKQQCPYTRLGRLNQGQVQHIRVIQEEEVVGKEEAFTIKEKMQKIFFSGEAPCSQSSSLT